MNKQTVKVLLINGNQDDFFEMSRCLGAHDDYVFEIEWKTNVEDGLNRAASNGFDICFLDSMLDEQNGIELINQARARGCDNPIILLSDEVEALDNEVAGTSNIESVIPKGGLTKDRVIDEVASALAKSKPHKLVQEPIEVEEPIEVVSKDPEPFQSFLEMSVTDASLSIVENLTDPVMVLDKQGKVMVVNKQFCSLMSLSSEEILGVNATLFLNCSKDDLVKAINGKFHHTFRTASKATGPARKHIYWSFSPVADSDTVSLVATGRVKERYERSRRGRSYRKRGFFYSFGRVLRSVFRNPLYVKSSGVHYHGDIFK